MVKKSIYFVLAFCFLFAAKTSVLAAIPPINVDANVAIIKDSGATALSLTGQNTQYQGVSTTSSVKSTSMWGGNATNKVTTTGSTQTQSLATGNAGASATQINAGNINWGGCCSTINAKVNVAYLSDNTVHSEAVTGGNTQGLSAETKTSANALSVWGNTYNSVTTTGSTQYQGTTTGSAYTHATQWNVFNANVN